MKTILFFTDLHAGCHQVELAGVREQAKLHNWRIIEVEYGRTDHPAEEFIDHWQPDGVIVECSYLRMPVEYEAYASVPVVFIDPNLRLFKDQSRVFSVCVHSEQYAQIAADELSKLNPACYGYVGWCGRADWSRLRYQAFRDQLAQIEPDKKLYCFENTWFRYDIVSFQKELISWLKSLPKPCGIFAANDETAEQIIISCLHAGIKCPDTISVLGVDNDVFRCESCTPSISSIGADYFGAGRMAIELLAKQFDNPDAPGETLYYRPTETVCRGSTLLLHTNDYHIRHALERIMRDACKGLTPKDVLQEIPYSRRLAEQRFRNVTGTSIGERILEVRFQEVLRLLRSTTCPITLIATSCGWNSDSFLKRYFKKRTGLSMREWRQRELHLKP